MLKPNQIFKILPIALVVITAFDAIAQTNNETSIEVTADKVPEVMKVVPGDAKLESRMPQTYVSQEYLENFAAPTASFVEAVAYTPSVLGVSQNGPGLNDNKVSLRGFNNTQFTMNFDGIPVNDTNGVSYHSTIWAPAQFLGGAGIDRSPGLASSFGPANYGGTFNFYSKATSSEKAATLYGSYGTWNTSLFGADFQTGAIGSEGKTQVAMGVHQMKSDGYMTADSPRRDGGYFKVDSELSKDVKLTVFGSVIDYFTSGPDGLKVYAQDTNPALAGLNPNYKGQNYYASMDPSRVDCNCYPTAPNGGATTEIRTYLNYIGLTVNINESWKMDNKLYNTSYNNHDIFVTPGSPNQLMSSITPPSAMNYLATDKHNTYQKFGDILRFTNENSLGQFRTGLWYELAVSSRFQNYFNPLSGAPLSPVATKFAENYNTTSFQPFAEFEFKVTDKLSVTPGFKYSMYNMSLSQNPDIGSSGPGGGFVGSQPSPILSNGNYRTPNPFLDIHYMIQPNWSAYAQFASGDVIPSTTVFDNKIGSYVPGTTAPSVLPPIIQTKSYQLGSVFKGKNFSVDGDVYLTRADGSLTPYYDPTTYNTIYFATGSGTYSGIEGQGTYAFDNGISVYGNASKMNAKYDSNGLNMASVPTDMETLGIFYKKSGWTTGAFVKRVGPQWVDNKSVNEWGQIPEMYLTGLYLNYDFTNLGTLAKSARIRFGIDNVFNQIYLTSLTPAGASSDPNRPGTNIGGNTLNSDTVTWSSGRFSSLSLFVNF